MSPYPLNPFAAMPGIGRAMPGIAQAVLGISPSNLSRSLLLVGFGGILLVLAVRRLRTYRLRERYALVFGLLGLPFIALAVWPDAVGWVAQRLNIQYNTLALLGVSCFLILAVFELLSIVSVQEQKITALAQLVGILMEKQKLAEPEHTPGHAVEPQPRSGPSKNPLAL